ILHWQPDPNATGYTIYRKALNATACGSAIATLSGTDTTYDNSNIIPGDVWEYRVLKQANGYSGQGFCTVGWDRGVRDFLGKVILVVDTTYAATLSNEIARMEEDLWGDGWQVIRLNVDRADSVTGIHDRIQQIWVADPANVRSVFLLGHVPVPYSGNLNPDGHADHQGAWPADAYYGEMNGTWTDQSVNNTNAARPENDNTIGDGKWDQSSIPGDVELEVGRVDFANMPAFAIGEAELLRRYLNKDHAWRMKQFTVKDSAVIDDNFGYFSGESFASIGWRNLSANVGGAHVYAGDFRTDLNARDHLWAYGCGGGWYQGASGVGSSSDFAADSLRGVFTMLFGSYHGDWDSQDNFMRAALASKGHVLTCSWAGRPHWMYSQMAVGEPIGYCARKTMNNFSTYPTGFGARGVHIALMGDPTLRMHQVAPPSNLTVTTVNGGAANQLFWTVSMDANIGYVIYRQDTVGERFWRVGQVGTPTHTFTDVCIMPGNYRYMVRAEALHNGIGGTYHNLSQGIFASATNTPQYTVAATVPTPIVFCPGQSITVPFTTGGPFCNGNAAFTLQWSDSTGSFTRRPPSAGRGHDFQLSSRAPSPLNALPGTGYRVRVNASNPAAIGSDNGTDLEVRCPSLPFSSNMSNLTASFTNTSQYAGTVWNFGDGSPARRPHPRPLPTPAVAPSPSSAVSSACGIDSISGLLTLVSTPGTRIEPLESQPQSPQPPPKLNPTHKSRDQSPSFSETSKARNQQVANAAQPHPQVLNLSQFARESTYLLEINQGPETSRKKIVLE
ncbi:MAG: hypothetical protein U0176_26775, partial [Bacteroidia bacterium]